jgi:hypothetical protein
MANIKIAVINQSTVVKDAEVKTVVAALSKQVKNDFAPIWGVDADLSIVDKAAHPPKGYWWLVILDNSDQAGALGYHDLTNEGLPLGKVFAGTDLQYNQKWSVTTSHELLEMLGDPDVNLSALLQTQDTQGTLYAYEVCDACEADEDGYTIDGIAVSDFVYPAWFETMWLTTEAGGVQFDKQKLLTRPFSLRPAGYASILQINAPNGWTQLNGPKSAQMYRQRALVGSRRERRAVGKTSWLRSNVLTKPLVSATS